MKYQINQNRAIQEEKILRLIGVEGSLKAAPSGVGVRWFFESKHPVKLEYFDNLGLIMRLDPIGKKKLSPKPRSESQMRLF